MKLYCVHCGYYMEQEQFRAIENHTVLFVVAQSMEEAKRKVKQKDIFKQYNMHVDGIMEIKEVDGFRVEVVESGGNSTNTSAWNYDEINE